SSALVSLSAARCFAKAHLSAADSAACAGIASEAVSSAAAMATIDANLAIELFVEMDLMTFPFINFDRSTISNGHRRNGAIRSAKELERCLGADTLRPVPARYRVVPARILPCASPGLSTRPSPIPSTLTRDGLSGWLARRVPAA